MSIAELTNPGRPQTSRLDALAGFAVRRRRLVLAGTVLFALLALAVGGSVVGRLSTGGYTDSGSESALAAKALDKRFGVGVPNLVLLVSAGRAVDDPSVARAGTALARELAGETGIKSVSSYWTSGSAGRRLRSRDGRSALIEARVGGTDDQVSKRVQQLAPLYRGRHGALEVGVTGSGEVVNETEAQIKHDLVKAERIALPLTLLALFFVFRGLLAAALPLAVGIVSIAGTLLSLRLITGVAPVSVFAVNIATALGLGLAIDYSLLIVERFRDCLRRGLEPPEAVVATVRTAGRTVLFSAATVGVSLAGLLVFPMYFLRSFAYAGVSAVVVATVCALVVMPALLAVVGRRIDALALRRWRRKDRGEQSGFWYRLANFVMRRPVPIAAGAIALLVLLGWPFLHVALGFPDDRNLPASAPARHVSDVIRSDFTVGEGATLFVLSDHLTRGTPRAAQVAGYERTLSRLDGVVAIDASDGTYQHGRRVARRPAAERRIYADGSATWLAVEGRAGPYSVAGERLSRKLRSIRAPFPGQVTGIAAAVADTKDELAARSPIAIAVIALTTFLALLALTGSVLVPLKALVMNALSLTAAFGALVYIFQDGHLESLVGNFGATGTINVLNPPLLFCVAFGLSMDYEVFMLSRIKEEHDRGRDTAGAVARGLQRTGPVITAAAAVMAIVFASTATTGVTGVKMLSVGLAIAVLVDATVVRVALVPAVMRLAGAYNWWAPRPLRRLQKRLGWVQGEPLPSASGDRR